MSDSPVRPRFRAEFPRGRWLLFVLPLVVGLAADLWTKSAMFRFLEFPDGMIEQRTHWWIDGVAGVQLSLNPGALWGLGSGWAPIFAMMSLVAAVGIIWWLFVAGAAKSRFLTLLLGFVMAGIFGNLYDRLGLHGIVMWEFIGGGQCFAMSGMELPAGLELIRETPLHVVRDWILVMIGSYHWPNFNLADCWLVSGAILLFGASVFAPKALGFPEPEPPPSSESVAELISEPHSKPMSDLQSDMTSTEFADETKIGES